MITSKFSSRTSNPFSIRSRASDLIWRLKFGWPFSWDDVEHSMLPSTGTGDRSGLGFVDLVEAV